MAGILFILILLSLMAVVGLLGAKDARKRKDESVRRVKEMIRIRHELREERIGWMSEEESVDNTFVAKRRAQLEGEVR